MVFHWSLNDSKSSQVSRTLLSILAVLNNAVVWMVPTRPPTSKSFSIFSTPLVTVPNCPLHVPQFFQFPSKVEVLILLFTFSQYYTVVSLDSKIDYFARSLFLLIIIKSGLLANLTYWEIFTPALPDCLSLESDCKSPLVSRTIFSILGDLNYAVHWMILIRP